MKQIKKRDGRIVDFDVSKIIDATRKAFNAVGVPADESVLDTLALQIAADLENVFGEGIPSVEHVQDRVELALMQGGFLDVAKHYIVYRYEHTKVREEKQEEVLEKIEENALMVTTRTGRSI